MDSSTTFHHRYLRLSSSVFLPAFELLFLKPISSKGETTATTSASWTLEDDGYRSFRRLLLDTLTADWISLRGGFDKNRPEISISLSRRSERNDGLNREGVREKLGFEAKIEKIKRGNCWLDRWRVKLFKFTFCIFDRLKNMYIYIIRQVLFNFIVRYIYKYFENAYRVSNEADLLSGNSH